MNTFPSPERSPAASRGFLLSVCLAAGLGLTHTLITSAQTPVASPTPVSTPVTDPVPTSTPDPTATPASTPTDSPTPAPVSSPTPVATPIPTGTPQITLTPGLPDPSVIAAYNALRTPLVDVTLNPAATGTSATPPTAVRQDVQGGVCTQITLQAPAVSGSKTVTGVTSQPVATVVLTYDMSWANQLVWVQMLGTGTLTADDGAGHIYDGSKGFFLTLDVNAMATFNYQAPNTGGTYQVYTRLDNIATVLPFFVPDPAP